MYLSVGSLTVRKDHATLLRAMARTNRGKLVIAGEGPLRASLERLSRELGLQDRVTLVGVQEDIAALMAKADVFVHPSIVEGFGLAVVEAMAAGLPVIASDVPGMRRILGESAVVFRTGDAEALAVCLKRLAEDRNLCASASAAGRERATQYGIEKMAAGYQLLYERLVFDTRGAFTSRG
jgi:glycosyltransferase involved in cell wall biosynthesis